MNCSECGYDFDPTHGLECPRCGEAVDCTAVSCADCGGCTGVIGGLRRRFGTEDADAS